LFATTPVTLRQNTSPGQYHTQHIQIFTMGTTAATFRVYLDAVKINELVGP